MRKATKTIISFAVILIAGLNFIVPAFAQDPFTAIAVGGLTGASGAGLFSSMAGMSGIGIDWGTNDADAIDAMWNVLNPDHVYFSGEKHEADPQSDPEDIYDYITVDIGDWLDAQSDFIINFAQEHNVTDNSTGNVTTYASYHGVPMIDGWSQYSLFTCPAPGVAYTHSVGPAEIRILTNHDMYGYLNGVRGDGANVINFTGKPVYLYYNGRIGWKVKDSNVLIGCGWDSLTPASQATWSSGIVQLNKFDDWENARVKIPRSVSGLSANWDIPDFLNAINDIWERNLQGQIVIEDTDQPVPPPTPVPVPSTPLGEVPFDDWVDLWGQGIYEQLENQSDALDFIGSAGEDAVEELESIDTSIQDLGETAESIDTNIGVGNGILGGIRSLAQSAVNYLEGIAEHVGELVEEIVEGTETLIAGILNQIPQAFSVIFGPIKQASSIWHYVVEWITSIGAPFQFIWSMASGTSYYVILPVYASLAAAVVLAFFKRFGR